MIGFTETLDIERPVEDVYAYVSDLTHTPEWNGAITAAAKTSPGPVAIGTRYRLARSLPRHDTEMLEIVALQPPRRIEVQGALARLPARLSYELEPTEAGTRLVNRVELDPQGPLRLLGPIVAGRIRGGVAGNLAALKRILERGTRRQGTAQPGT
ncbi:MAG: SRPBCC family protein [Acidimicrobiia bacterium]|jgi:hypothetical protein